MELKDLEVYQLSRELSKDAWSVYKNMDWHERKIIGDQWIRSVDSIGANVAEGFGRFHYLDKNRFNYNARGSLLEVKHWKELLYERKMIDEEIFHNFQSRLDKLHYKLNNYIKSTKEQNSNK